MPCMKCQGNVWECGVESSELCSPGAGWDLLGTVCLEGEFSGCCFKVYTKAGPKSGKCQVRLKQVSASEVEREAAESAH